MKKIGLLTGGGDCSGLNAAIRAVIRTADQKKTRIEGILEGWKGLLENNFKTIAATQASGILALGGTILGSSRVNPLKIRNGLSICLKNFKKHGLDALIVIGGEGTLKIASRLAQKNIPIVCIPKTIDNDTWATDYTIGFHTAVQIATDAIDRLHSTAESHHRVMIMEVMGRHAGWIATYAGLAGGADAVLVPEEVFKIKNLLQIIHSRGRRQRHFSIFVVSEDAKIQLENGKILKTPLQHDEYGDVKLGGIGEMLAHELRKRTDSEIRVTVLGHVQRGGTPNALDRILATRLGVRAVELVEQKKFGRLVVLKGNQIKDVSLEETANRMKKVDPEIYRLTKIFS